jgi:hypothetical protein
VQPLFRGDHYDKTHAETAPMSHPLAVKIFQRRGIRQIRHGGKMKYYTDLRPWGRRFFADTEEEVRENVMRSLADLFPNYVISLTTHYATSMKG